MKICATICEFNPLHNGHQYFLEQAKLVSGADLLVVIMSGEFVQRGECAVFDKYTRAKHAVLCGADCVLELPVPFATASAEIFAKGAVKLLAAIPHLDSICFGVESGTAAEYEKLARICLAESDEVRSAIQRELREGESLIRARAKALCVLHPGQAHLLSSPNNMLGIEYAKAVQKYRPAVHLLPILRKGEAYRSTELASDFSSATAIRLACGNGNVELAKRNVPPCVAEDLETVSPVQERLETLVFSALLSTPSEKLALVPDCTEGLENRLLSIAERTNDYAALVAEATSRRYTSARIRRILLANYLGISASDLAKFLQGDLYLRLLAVKRERAEECLSELGNAEFPLLARKRDFDYLQGIAADCAKTELKAFRLSGFVRKELKNPYMTLFI